MQGNKAQTQEEPIQVRFTFPKDVHSKIKTHQRKISAERDQTLDMEQAIIDYIRTSEIRS